MKTARQYADEIQEMWAVADREGRELTSAERAKCEQLIESAKAQGGLEKKLREFDPGFAARVGDGSPMATGGLGDRFIGSQGWKKIADPNSRGQKWTTGPIDVPWQTKAGTVFEGGQGAGLVPVPQVIPGAVETLFERPTIANLLGQAQATTSSVRYAVEGTATNNAAAVAEGGEKPASDLALSTADEQVRKIATVITVSDELLEDASSVSSYLNSRLSYFVQLQEDAQLLNGNGTPPNISGLLDRSGLLTYARGTVDNNAVAVFKAMNGLRGSAHVEPSAIVMNPANYQTTRLLQDNQAQFYGGGPWLGPYGGPNQAGASYPLFNDSLWNVPVVVTSLIGAGTALVGDFRQAARLYRRGGLRIEMTNSHEDYFQHDLVMIRAELREALCVFRESAFVQVTGLS
jgi:HK97 family phage major capsid protein